MDTASRQMGIERYDRRREREKEKAEKKSAETEGGKKKERPEPKVERENELDGLSKFERGEVTEERMQTKEEEG